MKWIAIILVILLSFLPKEAPGDETETSLTIYNEDLALVREVREFELTKGENIIEFVDVASKIDPTSVHFKSLTSPDAVAILEQNYEYDLVSSAKILEKYVDQNVQIFTKDDKIHEGRLLSFLGRDIVLGNKKGGIEILRLETVENIQFSSLPEGLITRPTLIWLINCRKGGSHRTEVSYLTAGMSWQAQYVALTNEDGMRLELEGRVSIDNHSGATYENAKVKLVAGDVHRIREELRPIYRPGIYAAKRAMPQFEEKPFFEYHLYTLDRRTTLRNNQIRQLSLFPSAQLRVRKVYSFDGERDGRKVKVKFEFKNSEEAGLGMALPGGKVRVYKEDMDGSLEFVGEDLMNHTPVGKEVRLILGDTFDLVGGRKVVDHRKITERTEEETIEVALRNHKDEGVEVVVIEHLRDFWEILKTTHDFEKRDAQTVEFKVPVDKEGEAKVRYTVRHVR